MAGPGVARELVPADARPDFAYETWQRPIMDAEPVGGAVDLTGLDGRGGYGYLLEADLTGTTGIGDTSPALRVTVGRENRAAALRLLLRDADGTEHRYRFAVPRRAGVHTLAAFEGASLTAPNHVEAVGDTPGLDLAALRQAQVMGDWRPEVFALRVEGVTLALAGEEAVAKQRQREAERSAAQSAQAAAVREARRQIKRGPEAPRIVHAAAVAPRLLALEIHAGDIAPQAQRPYAPQPGDEVRPHDEHAALVWHDGTLAVRPEHWALHRLVDGQLRPVAFITDDRRYVWPFERLTGHPLSELLADQPDSYALHSDNDPDYRRHVAPRAVHRKSKPRQMTDPDKAPAMLHRVYLEFPHPLATGAEYTLHLDGVNTQRETLVYRHAPRQTRSEAVHVSQIGYRPDDPHKAAYLSLWLGTGGGWAYDDVPAFELLDAQGRTVYTGSVAATKAIGQPEMLAQRKDYTRTAVYRLDFGGFDSPGKYRVFVPGVGTSAPFRIGADVWAEAFAVSMRGLLHHRSGLALGPPLTPYRRPRPFHPGDGVSVFALDATMDAGESAAVNASLQRLTNRGQADRARWPDTDPRAWGGYMDAGDWDRRSPHLLVSYRHLELFELFPDYFDALPLALPEDEAANALPDLLDEVLWNVSFYRRLQDADGGVSGGVESTAHPRWGEASWQESLAVGRFAPDAASTLRFAAVAAKLSAQLRRHDPGLAADYRDAAQRAWDWALTHQDRLAAQSPRPGRTRGATRAAQNLAAVELLALTGEPIYDEALAQHSALARPDGEPDEAVAFAYARLPEGVGDPARKDRARRHVLSLADRAIAFAQGNAYRLHNAHPDLPAMGYLGYFSVPGMTSHALPRAHALTSDRSYLAATVASADFSAGANPDNLAYTTGLGWNAPRFPLHIDSRITGQPAPAGITVYGPCDPQGDWQFIEWMHTWFLSETMTPDSREWPMHESYVDGARWPAVNEYTVHQTLGPTGYTWGYLAARAALHADGPSDDHPDGHRAGAVSKPRTQ